MGRFFNTAGTCLPERRLPEVRGLIDQGMFFVLRAPWQTGKTAEASPQIFREFT